MFGKGRRRFEGGGATGSPQAATGRLPRRGLPAASLWRRPWLGLAALSALALTLAGCATDGGTQTQVGLQTVPLTTQVLATGLDNPRGVAVTPDGAVLVAEAGSGGDDVCTEVSEGGDTVEVCLGHSGAVTRVKGGVQERIVTGLPSLLTPEGALGPSDIDVHGNGNTYLVNGLGGPPSIREEVYGTAGAYLGHVLRLNQVQGTFSDSADISAFEVNNPDAADPGSAVDSDPYSVARIPGGLVVADAGGNDLLKVDEEGNVSLLAVFHATMVPNVYFPGPDQIPMQAVPTSVAVGPDGAYYVGTLTGFPFLPGAAKVYRVVEGQDPEVFADGFTNIIGVAFDGADLLVLEMVRNGLLNLDPSDPSTQLGALYRVHPDGSSEEVQVADGLLLPGGLAVGRDGTVFVSTCDVCIGQGQLVALHP